MHAWKGSEELDDLYGRPNEIPHDKMLQVPIKTDQPIYRIILWSVEVWQVCTQMSCGRIITHTSCGTVQQVDKERPTLGPREAR